MWDHIRLLVWYFNSRYWVKSLGKSLSGVYVLLYCITLYSSQSVCPAECRQFFLDRSILYQPVTILPWTLNVSYLSENRVTNDLHEVDTDYRERSWMVFPEQRHLFWHPGWNVKFLIHAAAFSFHSIFQFALRNTSITLSLEIKIEGRSSGIMIMRKLCWFTCHDPFFHWIQCFFFFG